ncbi:hypothetical protein IEO21_10346 [Rhodonia placenta]|uniref:Uncharacterized protein n=1 Tax=Rhodonia placenta TaxID=104341 RepID=A0A8H7NSP0_9APHY|nr:hypothetical protein IEO21_10346 [Postia placenta]
MLRTGQLRTDQHAQPPLNFPCILPQPTLTSYRLGGAHPYDTLPYVASLLYITTTRGTNSSVPALHLGSCCILAKSSTGPHVNCEPQCYLGRCSSPSSQLPQTVASTSQGGGDPNLPADTAPESESEESASEEGVSEPEHTLLGRPTSPNPLPSSPPVTVVRDTTSGLPPPPVPSSPPQGHSCTRSPRSPPSRQQQPPPLPLGHSPSPPAAGNVITCVPPPIRRRSSTFSRSDTMERQ